MYSFTFAAWLSSAILLLTLLGGVLVLRQRQRQMMLTGIQLLQAGRILLVHLQQHRGLTAARLAGVRESFGSIPELRRQVLANMATMSELDEWFALNENWMGVTRHWASLSAKTDILTPDVSFDQHSRLIAAVLELLAEVASHYGMETNSRYDDSRVIWREYLWIGELIGQCRGLGMEVLTHGQRYQMRPFFKKRIVENVKAITSLLEDTPCRRQLNERQKKELEKFLCFVSDQLLEDKQMVSAMEFFNVASKVIELVYEQFDIEMLKLHRKAAG